ncbi:protein HEXIM1 [Spea bombifrons]|uniref:protein HEXIM1 n=1 Tax=Spea bombifrons TaxID=233779 RepID=UPI00234991D0|nr:protein HEXIM1 [Spea bombifrons]
MAEVGVQETTVPCKSLTGGDSLLPCKDSDGWGHKIKEEKEECLKTDASTLSCPEEEDHNKVAGYQRPGQFVKCKQEDEWKQLGKKRHRRRPSKNKRRWKPYNKLTWEEKKLLEEKESQRASRMRAEMFAKGQPVAPYNTTQFLMEDHVQEEPDLCPPQRRAFVALPLCNANSFTKGDSTEEDLEEEEDGTGSDGMDSNDGTEFLQRDFSETYERYHAESLQDMSKQDLIREYLELEKCLSRMEEENNRLRLQGMVGTQVGGPQDSRISELEKELEKLKEENERLLREKELVAANPSEH